MKKKNTAVHKSDMKLSGEELQAWIARRKKCHAHSSKKDFKREKRISDEELYD